MTSPERRRHRRFRARQSIQFLRGEAEVAGEIFNISRSGCLLVTTVDLKPGERVDAHLPFKGCPSVSLQVIRARAVGPWFAVAVAFEPLLPSEEVLEKLSTSDPAPEVDPEQLF